MLPKVLIVGVGAIGSHLAMALRNHADLTLVDFDRVESKNLLSQAFVRQSMDKNKAKAKANELASFYQIKARALTCKLIPDNVQVVCKDQALVIDCLDNLEARTTLQTHTRENNIPALHVGVTNDGSFGQVMWDDMFIPDQETPGAATCEDGQFLPFIQTVASVAAITTQLFLTDGKQVNSFVHGDGLVRRV